MNPLSRTNNGERAHYHYCFQELPINIICDNVEFRNMTRRTKDWNEGLARDLKNIQFAREFLLSAIDEGISLQHALGKVIQAMGVKEFAAKIGMESPNLLRHGTIQHKRP
jgi:hypothetical protein